MAASLSSFHYSNPGRHGCGPPGPKGPRHCPPPTATSGSRSCRAGTDRCQRTVRAKSTEGVVVSTVEAVTGAGPLDAGACAGPEVAMPLDEVGAVTVAQPHEANRTPDTPALKVTGTPARATPWTSVTLAASGLRAAPALTRWGGPGWSGSSRLQGQHAQAPDHHRGGRRRRVGLDPHAGDRLALPTGGQLDDGADVAGSGGRRA